MSTSCSSSSSPSTAPSTRQTTSASHSSLIPPQPSPLFIPELFSRIIYFVLFDNQQHLISSPATSCQHEPYQLSHNCKSSHIPHKQSLQGHRQQTVYRVDRQEQATQTEQGRPQRPVLYAAGETETSDFWAHTPSSSSSTSSQSSPHSSLYSNPSTLSPSNSFTTTATSSSPLTSSSSTSSGRSCKKDSTRQQYNRLNCQSPGITIVTCAQVCKSWSEQLLPLLWHTITMDTFDQPHSLFLSTIAAHRCHMAPGVGNAASKARPLEPSFFLSTAAFLPPPPLPPPLYEYSQNQHHLHHSAHHHQQRHFHPYPSPHTSYFHANTTMARNMPGPIVSHGLDQTSSSYFPTSYSVSSTPFFYSSLNSSHPHPSPHIPPNRSFPQHPQLQQPHIATGIPINGHFIHRLQVTNPTSIRYFDHPSVCYLTDLSCVVSPPTCSQDFVAAENIMTRNLRHQLQRLQIGSGEVSCAGGIGMESLDGANSSNKFPHLHHHPFIQQQQQQQQSNRPNGRSNSSSEGHSSADRIHNRTTRIGTISTRRQQHCRQRSSLSSGSSTATAKATGMTGTTTAASSGCASRQRHHQNHPHNGDHDHPRKKRTSRHSLINSGGGCDNSPSIAPSSYSPPSIVGSIHNNNNSNNGIDQTSSSLPFQARPYYHSHDGDGATHTNTNNTSPASTSTAPQQDKLLFAPPLSLPPAHLTQLSLFQYTFLLDEWVEMMRMLPSLLYLDLEIINILPSPSSSLSVLGSAKNSGPRSSSSLLLSQSLWNVHPSSLSPPSSSPTSSPTLITSREAAYRQSCSSSSGGISGHEDGTNTSFSSSSDSSDKEEDLHLGRLVIDNERSGPIAIDSSLPLPLLSSMSLSTPPLAHKEPSRAATAGFSTGESDDDDLSFRPSRRSKTQHYKGSHKESPYSTWNHTRKQQGGTSNAMASNSGNGGYNRSRQQQRREEEAMMTPLVLSLVFQFPSVRSLNFHGPSIIPELLEFLPNLESLALQPSPTPSSYSPGHAKKSRTWSARGSSRSSLALESSLSLFLDMSQILQDKCQKITRLVLTEPSIMTDPSILRHLPDLFQTMPNRLIHVELSLSTSTASSSPRSATVKQLEREVIDALVEYHGEHLQVFVVIIVQPPLSSAKVVDDPVSPRHYFAQLQQAQAVVHTPLDNVSFEFGSQQQHQQNLNYFPISHQQRPDQEATGQDAFIPTPSHTHTAVPTAHTTNLTKISPTHPLLQVLESCPSLRIADCRLPIPLQEVIASSPNWVCHSRLQVLRLELEELTSSGGKAMDEDEEAVMGMFVKSLFTGSSSARMPLGEDEASVKVEEEDEESWRSTSEVGESSSWSSASATGQGASQVSSRSSFPPSPAGSTTTATSVSSGDSMTAALPIHHMALGPDQLEETGLASGSLSPSSSLSSWTSRSTSSRAPTSTTTSSSPLSSSSGISGVSVSDTAGQRRQDMQQRVLGQSFATDSPTSLPPRSTSLTGSSSAGSSSTGSSSSNTRGPIWGSFFPPPTLSSSSSFSSSSASPLPKSNSKSSPLSSTSSSSSTSTNSGDIRSRQAVSAFLSTCSNYQVDAVGRLMALQFLVEHQLATMPQLECFHLGKKAFRIPLRRV